MPIDEFSMLIIEVPFLGQKVEVVGVIATEACLLKPRWKWKMMSGKKVKMIKMWECPAISTQCHYSIFKTQGCPRQSQLRSEGGSKAGRNTKSQEQHKSAAKSVVKSSNCISMIGPQ